MFSSRDAFENDFCPVRDELLGEMYRANANGLPQLVESVSSEVRAMLALFCYRRSHLHSLALAIAASCSERELIQFGGRVGSTLYALSREPADAFRAVIVLRQPQADHALDQAALHLLADRRRARRRDFARSRHGVERSRPPDAVRSHQRRQAVPSAAPSRIRHRRACRFGRLRAAPHRSRTTSRRRPCPTAPSTDRRRSACPTAVR